MQTNFQIAMQAIFRFGNTKVSHFPLEVDFSNDSALIKIGTRLLLDAYKYENPPNFFFFVRL